MATLRFDQPTFGVVQSRETAGRLQLNGHLLAKHFYGDVASGCAANVEPLHQSANSCYELRTCASRLFLKLDWACAADPFRWAAACVPKDSNLVDPASSHTLVSKIKPCMSKYKQLYCETANGSLYQL